MSERRNGMEVRVRDAGRALPTAETVAWENCMKASATVTATRGSGIDMVRPPLLSIFLPR